MRFTVNYRQPVKRPGSGPLFCLFVGLVVGLVLLGIGTLGCSGSASAPEKTAPAPNDEHGHDEHGHDEHGHDEHAHPTEGPHHGQLIELGDEAYHGEWVPDATSKTVSIYILDGHAEKEVPIGNDAAVINLFVDGVPRQIQLLPRPSAGGGANQASRFELPRSAQQAVDGKEGRGELRVTIQGKSYRGPLPKP